MRGQLFWEMFFKKLTFSLHFLFYKMKTDIIYPMGGVKKMKEMGPDYVQNLNLLAIRSIGMLEGRIPIDHDDAISLDEVFIMFHF